MVDTIIKVDLNQSAYENDQIHNRWHPDIPMACWVNPGDDFILETYDWTGGYIKNNDSADDVRDIDLSTVHYLSGPVGVHGAEPGDLLVVNDTRVIPARLALRRARGAAVEGLLLTPVQGRTWEALVRPSRRLREGETLLGRHDGDDRRAGLTVTLGPLRGEGRWEITFDGDDPVDQLLDHWGEVPLPPYITAGLDDPERYQTVYARRPGSVAAPTAGLHLSTEVLDALHRRGVRLATVELVVGLGTFRPITVERVEDHVMHEERYRIPPETVDALASAGTVVAIGTTVVRTLESWAATGRTEGATSLFIHRPYQWKVVDLLMTNFHLPRTTLLMMIDAFVGERWRVLYREAIEQRYRFLSFGDAMLLDRSLS